MVVFKKSSGFTALELLIGLVIISLIFVFSVPVYNSFQNRSDIFVIGQGFRNSVRRAQFLSQSMSFDASWGVAITSSSIVTFKGSTYATRDIAYDEEILFSQNINVVGLREIVFSKLAGLPSATGTVIFSNSRASSTMTINEKGIIY